MLIRTLRKISCGNADLGASLAPIGWNVLLKTVSSKLLGIVRASSHRDQSDKAG